MKKSLLFLLYAVFLMNSLPAQEMRLSIGPDVGFGMFQVNNEFGFKKGAVNYLYGEESNSLWFAPGFSLLLRWFDTDGFVSSGFVLRERALFVTNYRQSGSAWIDDGLTTLSTSDSEAYSAADDNFFASVMDIGMGYSVRYRFTEGLSFYTDFGVNFTMMDWEDYDTDGKLNYFGIGIFSVLSTQMNLSKALYLEFGLNATFNIVSNQEGTFYFSGQEINYEDSGNIDSVSMSTYIHFGWRVDFQKP